MGVIVDVQELNCSVPPATFFKAFLLDSNHLMPKILPQVFKSIDYEEGSGAPGSVKVLSYIGDGGEVKKAKHRVDEVDEANLVYKVSMIDAETLGEDFESVHCENKVEAGPDGGCILKATTTYNTKGDNHTSIQEQIKKAKDGLVAFFQAAVDHLHSNPNEYK